MSEKDDKIVEKKKKERKKVRKQKQNMGENGEKRNVI